MTARRFFLPFVLFVVFGLPMPALGQSVSVPSHPADLPQRQATFAWEKNESNADQLVASFSYVDVLDAGFRAKLSNGLPHVVLMRAYFLREGESNPVALAARTCRITFDLWEEVYRLKISGPGTERDTAALTIEGVQRLCFEARRIPVTDRALAQVGKPHFLGVIVEINPVNAQMVEPMRKWVTRPAGSTGIGPGDALFGSFVGLFVRAPGRAERSLLFRTQSFSP